MKTKLRQYRQGDVFLAQVEEIPQGLNQLPSDSRAVLAHGEVTGHAHAFAPGVVAAWTEKKAEPEVEASYIEVAEALAELRHEEHGTIPVPAGKYKVVIQREYAPEAPRRVLD